MIGNPPEGFALEVSNCSIAATSIVKVELKQAENKELSGKKIIINSSTLKESNELTRRYLYLRDKFDYFSETRKDSQLLSLKLG